MKITPIVNGAPISTPNPAAQMSNSRERAMAAYNGQQAAQPQFQPQQQQNVNRIQMRTQASPEQFDAQGGESAMPDDNGQANGTVEATQPLSPQFAALAKHRRALQVKERELAEREKALTGAPPGDADLIAKLKSQPLSVLQEHGVTYDQLTEAILANQNGLNPDIQRLQAEIQALKEGVDKTLKDKDTQAEQQVLAQMKRDAELLAKDGDDFEMVRETRSIPDVMQLIERTYRETGEVLDVRDAMQLVEEELLTESVRIASIKKLQSRLTPQPMPYQQRQSQMRTLTNRDTARAPLSAKARAIAAFHGTLNK